jgi:phosphohistidine phosphatase
LVRHAKSSQANDGERDFDRPLNDRGYTDAPLMAKVLIKRKIKPELILASDAKRTSETAQILAKELDIENSLINYSNKLYLSSVKDYIKKIRKTDSDIKELMVIGHNPVVTELANELTGSFIDNMPTSGVVSIHFKDDSWKAVGTIKGKMAHFDFPKKFK